MIVIISNVFIQYVMIKRSKISNKIYIKGEMIVCPSHSLQVLVSCMYVMYMHMLVLYTSDLDVLVPFNVCANKQNLNEFEIRHQNNKFCSHSV